MKLGTGLGVGFVVACLMVYFIKPNEGNCRIYQKNFPMKKIKNILEAR